MIETMVLVCEETTDAHQDGKLHPFVGLTRLSGALVGRFRPYALEPDSRESGIHDFSRVLLSIRRVVEPARDEREGGTHTVLLVGESR